ncbi:Putative DNA repair helicase RadD [Methylobacterium soli]|nr:Putative DNA repair helicase RadD [Methylobacterium soli]
MLSLRDYQRASLDALYGHWAEGGGNGLIVLPTGAGKALVIAALVRETLERWPDLRICIVTHVRELVSQNFKELLGYWPGAPAGIYSAGLGRRDTHSRILFCGMQSVWNKVARLGAFDLVIVDEAHLIPRASDTS